MRVVRGHIWLHAVLAIFSRLIVGLWLRATAAVEEFVVEGAGLPLNIVCTTDCDNW